MRAHRDRRVNGGRARAARAVLWAAGALCLLAPPPAGAAGVAAAAEASRPAFCAGLAGIVRAENARAAEGFEKSLADVPQTVRGERRVETDAVLTPDEALTVAGRLWALWVPTAPAGSVAVVEDTPDAWVLAPAPGPDAPAATGPIRIDKHTGKVAWKLPHPSEHERLHAEMCGAGG